jgi:hypothetical protein
LFQPEPFHGAAVNGERVSEGVDGREETLLEAGDEEEGFSLLAFGGGGETALTDVAVGVEEAGQGEFRGGIREVADVDLDDSAFRKSAGEGADVFLETPDHDVVEVVFEDRDAAGESLGIEQFEEGAEAVGVAVVRRGGEEKAMFEARGEVADSAGDFRVDGVAGAAGGCGVVGFVEDEESAGAKVLKPVAQGRGVGFVDEEFVGDEEPWEGCPWVDAVSAFLADAFDEGAVEDFEDEAEALLEFFFPLFEHGGRAGDDDFADAAAEQEFGSDEAGFDGFAETDVVGDEEVDPWEPEGFAEGFELVGVDADACAERCLKEGGVGGSDAVPAEGVEVGAEVARGIEAASAEGFPCLFVDDGGEEFEFPEALEGFALGIIFDADE